MNCWSPRMLFSCSKSIQFSFTNPTQLISLKVLSKGFSNKRFAHSGLYNVETGKTIRILQDRVPLLPQKALPDEVLSRNIELNLFPYHLNLPKIEGLVIYRLVFKTARILLASAYSDGVKKTIDIESQVHTPLSPKSTRYTMKCHWIASYSDEYNCIFHFDINSKGLIYRHIIENLERKKAGHIARIPALEPGTFE
ncbi:mitochondrial protein, C6orf136-like protein [Schizosaccharomyces osmophilus]|uniref:Mitochondrial protein, C6orf136-like protein n=1 Tax=Schizosaccharomyces osmophilus TaxID=2545709 RepID=A0AAF0AXT8_9SCHI|nr:mitochondrial protein, C6orf136-like protein [Schizosaccharomyces osmophilus]WBW75077.1 mitochondrial protein, C6orf136-like protein [Schizosaccharomyces osmophilus]